MSQIVVGVDIGGTKVLAGVVDRDGRVEARVRRDTPHRSSEPQVVEDTIVAVVEELRATYDVTAVGVGAAGFVDLRGNVLFAPHLSWRGEPLREILESRLGLSVVVDYDANAAAHAEMRYGAGRDHRHALLVTLGTGIGGAIVSDGRVLRGAHGLAGEFGHMQVAPDGRPCECGQAGCWEQYASGRALVRAAALDVPGADRMSGLDVGAAATRGEGWALAAFEEVGTWLGIGLAGLAAAYDPELIIVGGGLSETGDLLLDPARRAFAARLPGAAYRPEVGIVRAELGAEAGLVGAADLARVRLEEEATT